LLLAVACTAAQKPSQGILGVEWKYRGSTGDDGACPWAAHVKYHVTDFDNDVNTKSSWLLYFYQGALNKTRVCCSTLKSAKSCPSDPSYAEELGCSNDVEKVSVLIHSVQKHTDSNIAEGITASKHCQFGSNTTYTFCACGAFASLQGKFGPLVSHQLGKSLNATSPEFIPDTTTSPAPSASTSASATSPAPSPDGSGSSASKCIEACPKLMELSKITDQMELCKSMKEVMECLASESDCADTKTQMDQSDANQKLLQLCNVHEGAGSVTSGDKDAGSGTSRSSTSNSKCMAACPKAMEMNKIEGKMEQCEFFKKEVANCLVSESVCADMKAQMDSSNEAQEIFQLCDDPSGSSTTINPYVDTAVPAKELPLLAISMTAIVVSVLFA